MTCIAPAHPGLLVNEAPLDELLHDSAAMSGFAAPASAWTRRAPPCRR